jgi:hypothetical protein
LAIGIVLLALTAAAQALEEQIDTPSLCPIAP